MREAIAMVVAAAMRWGPVKVPRIAAECDLPVETCRFYLRRYHSLGFRFLPVVDYQALGLAPHIVFVRRGSRLGAGRAWENFLRWFETVYTVYSAGFENMDEYVFQTAVPQTELKKYRMLLDELLDDNLIQTYRLLRIMDGQYTADWVRMYDFSRGVWADELKDLNLPKIPITTHLDPTPIDPLDLSILVNLELDPKTKMRKLSSDTGHSQQLISYHRQRHVDGRLVTGYIPIRQTKWEDVKVTLIMIPRYGGGEPDAARYYLHSRFITDNDRILRLHSPSNLTLMTQNGCTSLGLRLDSLHLYATPIEHYEDGRWKGLDFFLEQLKHVITVDV